MYTKQEIIILSHREGKSQRSISLELGISRKTIRKYLEKYESLLKSGVSAEVAQSSYLTSVPVYATNTRSKLKLTREVQKELDGLIELNRQKKSQGLHKQLMKKKDMLEELHRRDIDIGYTTVCNYVSSQTTVSKPKEAYIRQRYAPGRVCEFDWGEIKLYINGRQVRLQLAVFTSAYSNYRYAFIYNRQDTLSFMESHVRFFETIGGVFHQMVYDNMRVAVSRFVGPHEKEPTAALLQLRGHYGFTHRFCNAYRGNEKGHVERSVEYVRRKAFGLKDHFTDLGQAEEWLSKVLDKLNAQQQSGTGKSAMQMLEEELPVLAKHPSSKPVCAEQVQLRVDKYATVSFRTNRYSVPDHLVGEFVDVSVLSNELSVYHQNNKVALHKRSFEKHHWTIEIEHYLSTFKRKPGALAGSIALASSCYLEKLYRQYFTGEARNFIDLLVYCREHKVSEEKLEETVRRLLTPGSGVLTTEKLRALLGNQETPAKLLVLDKIYTTSKQQLSELTALMRQMN